VFFAVKVSDCVDDLDVVRISSGRLEQDFLLCVRVFGIITLSSFGGASSELVEVVADILQAFIVDNPPTASTPPLVLCHKNTLHQLYLCI